MDYNISLMAARINAGLRREDVAKRVGVSYATIANWEKGVTAPRVTQAKELADIYNISFESIFLSSDSKGI